MIRVATTENGIVKGLRGTDARITSFKGIPFAAPPVGKNRWRAPQPCENWEGTLNAFEYAPISVQDTPGLGTDIYCREWHVDPDIAINEDCLYLNVWTSAKKTDEKQPVMVWFFGGGFQWGYTSEMEFDGEQIAKRGVVVVTVNYRLGALGFLAHPQLTKEQPDAPTNFGALDQQAGLNWVIRNIAAFGGDPNNITIAGQSAGAGSVINQMICKENFGKFHKAIILSGMIQSPYIQFPLLIPLKLNEAEENGKKFFEFLGVETLEEARELDPFFIRDKYAKFRETNPMMAPVIDGLFCTDVPLKLFMRNERAQVPVMSGNTEDEFPNFIDVTTEDELRQKAVEFFGDDAETFLQFSEAHERFEDKFYAPVNGIACTVKEVFLQSEASNNGLPCYYYEFAPHIPGWDNPGTFHSVDLWFFFETLAKCWRPFTGKHYDLARQMCNYWTNFMKTGDPNGEDCDGTPMPRWDSYTKDNPCEMRFTTDGAVTQVKEPSEYNKFMMEQIKKQLLK